jgi:hypothetical protein
MRASHRPQQNGFCVMRLAGMENRPCCGWIYGSSGSRDVPCCGRQIAQGFTPVSGRERRTEVRWEFGRYLLNLSDAQPASLVKLTLWVEPRTITVMVPEIPYS